MVPIDTEFYRECPEKKIKGCKNNVNSYGTAPARNKLQKIAIDIRTQWSIAELLQSRLNSIAEKPCLAAWKGGPSPFVIFK